MSYCMNREVCFCGHEYRVTTDEVLHGVHFSSRRHQRFFLQSIMMLQLICGQLASSSMVSSNTGGECMWVTLLVSLGMFDICKLEPV